MSDRDEELRGTPNPDERDPVQPEDSMPGEPALDAEPSDGATADTPSALPEDQGRTPTTNGDDLPERADDGAEEAPGPYDRLFGPDDVNRQTTEVGAGEIDPDAELDAQSVDADAIDDDASVEEDVPRRPRIAVLIAGILLLAIVGGGIGLLAARWRTGGGDEQTIARVGQTDISRGEFTRSWVDGQDAQEVLDQLIDFELVVQAARTEGAPVDTAAIDQQVKELKAQHGDDTAQFETFLKENQIGSEEKLRGLMERQQLVEAMVLKHTTLEQARASHILLAASTPEDIAKRKPEAEDLLKQIQDGADFGKLAEEKSEDPGSKVKGGDLGWAPRGVFVPEFDEAIFSMKQGEIRLVQSSFGWHIIKLDNPAEVRGLESQDYFQSPPVMTAFTNTFLPWVKGLRTDADQKGLVTVYVQPTDLVPTPGPTLPAQPAPEGPVPDGPAPDGSVPEGPMPEQATPAP